VTTETDLNIETHELKKAALIVRAINHKLRQQLLQFIHQRGTVTVTELYVKLHLEQSVASQHLAILRKAGYVLTKREGKCIYYAVNYQRLGRVQEDCRCLLNPKQ
jgi:DNA-binding transcriptional ArsR family regulator